MGFPKPWPTEWPEPPRPPDRPDGSPDKEREEDWEEDPVPLPEDRLHFSSVTWAINHHCNLRCTHCYDYVSHRRADLSTGDALALIDRLGEAGVDFIAFSGGEPFLRKDLLDLMRYCRGRDIDFGARCNGTRIFDNVASSLKGIGISVVGVSFDGASAASHDAVRGAGAFESTLAGIAALVAEGIRTQMEVVLSRANAHEALAFIELGEALGVAEVNFSAMAPQGRALNRVNELLDHRLAEDLTSMLREASVNARVEVSPNCALTGPCVACVEPHVTCDGWMTPCYLSAQKLFPILETSPQLIREKLLECRRDYIDVCGRAAWNYRRSCLVQLTSGAAH